MRLEHLEDYLDKAGWELLGSTGFTHVHAQSRRQIAGYLLTVKHKDSNTQLQFHLPKQRLMVSKKIEGINAFALERHLDMENPKLKRASDYYDWLFRPWYRKVYDYLFQRKAY